MKYDFMEIGGLFYIIDNYFLWEHAPITFTRTKTDVLVPHLLKPTTPPLKPNLPFKFRLKIFFDNSVKTHRSSISYPGVHSLNIHYIFTKIYLFIEFVVSNSLPTIYYLTAPSQNTCTF